jgi:hypothetical protein
MLSPAYVRSTPESYDEFSVLGNPAHDGRPPQPRRMTMQDKNSINSILRVAREDAIKERKAARQTGSFEKQLTA